MNQDELIQKLTEVLSSAPADESETLAQRIMSVVFPSLFVEEEKQEENVPALESWQARELAALLSPDYKPLGAVATAVEGDTLYLRPEQMRGQRRYHMVVWDTNLTIEQTDYAKQYPPRVTFDAEEFEPFLRQLILWYLEGSRPPTVEQLPAGQDDGGLGTIEDHPF